MEAKFEQLLPYDKHNVELEANVHPDNWKNPTADSPYHLVVIGAGTAGLVTAAAAAGLGARVALIERELMGGDCLNVGCVPSKALISSARVAAVVRNAGQFGVRTDETFDVDFSAIMERMRSLRAKISPVDSAKRFADLGVDVYFGQGAFVDKKTIMVTNRDSHESKLSFKKAVIATGARAASPPIPGLGDVEFLTNENLFSLTELPPRLAVIGSGPIGCEMAQSFARFGSQVFLFEMTDRVLSREDQDASAVVQNQLLKDGVKLLLNTSDMEFSKTNIGKAKISIKQEGTVREVEVDRVLIAVGRKPNIDGLNLDAVGVDSHKRGVVVNDHLQTTNPNIFAAGDVCSKFQFTHSADFQARIVIQNSLFAIGPFGRKKASDLLIPWGTYTSPEIAHVGKYEHELVSEGIQFNTFVQPFEHVDRAILESKDEGFVKVLTKAGTDKILGATIVAENAGDLISEISVAMQNKIGLSGIGATIHPYPTQADAIRKLGDQFNKTKLTPMTAKVLAILRWINVGN